MHVYQYLIFSSEMYIYTFLGSTQPASGGGRSSGLAFLGLEVADSGLDGIFRKHAARRHSGPHIQIQTFEES